MKNRLCLLAALLALWVTLTGLGAETTEEVHQRAHALDAEKRYDESRELWDQLKKAEPENEHFKSARAQAEYNVACRHAVKGQDQLALDVLLSALRLGYLDTKHIRRDPDWAALRDDERFEHLMVQADAIVEQYAEIHYKLAEVWMKVKKSDDALKSLKAAVDNTQYSNLDKLRTDPMWDPVRESAEFDKLLAAAEENAREKQARLEKAAAKKKPSQSSRSSPPVPEGGTVAWIKEFTRDYEPNRIRVYAVVGVGKDIAQARANLRRQEGGSRSGSGVRELRHEEITGGAGWWAVVSGVSGRRDRSGEFSGSQVGVAVGFPTRDEAFKRAAREFKNKGGMFVGGATAAYWGYSSGKDQSYGLDPNVVIPRESYAHGQNCYVQVDHDGRRIDHTCARNSDCRDELLPWPERFIPITEFPLG